MDTTQDQQALFDSLLQDTQYLPTDRLHYVAWAAAMATRDASVVAQVKDRLGPLSDAAQREVEFAVMRMSVTNPYYVARNVLGLRAGGDLSALGLRPLAEVKLQDEVSYHYACVAVSMLNGGLVCLGSHAGSLRQSGESEIAIDFTLRLTTAIAGMRAKAFVENLRGTS